MIDAKKSSIGQVDRKVAFLDSKEMIRNPVNVFEKYRTKLGPTFTFHFGGVKKTIVSADPDFIQHVLKENHSNYAKSDIQVKRMVEFQGIGLLNSHGDIWAGKRRLLSNGFNRSHLKNLLPVQLQVLEEFMDAFDKDASRNAVDIYQQMVKYTLRLVGKSLFGLKMKDDDLEQIGNTITQIQSFMLKQIVQPYRIPWYRISGKSEQYQKLRRSADQLVLDYIEQRRSQGDKGIDLIEILINTPVKGTGVFMTDNEIKTEILQLLVAGNETSSNTLAWTFYLLAKNPDDIKRIRAEVKSVLGDSGIDYNKFHELEYTLMVINEVMRLYPPFWTIDRVALEDDEINGIHIPRGVTVMPYIFGVHRNQKYWKEPEIYNPNRFSNNEQKSRHPFAHIPFGGGPRVCIGQNMAFMQILLIVVELVRRYDFRLNPEQDIAMQPMLILRPKGKMNMDFIPV